MATRQQGYGTRWNRKAVVVTGYSVAEAEGTSIMHFVEPSMKQTVELNLLKALKGLGIMS